MICKPLFYALVLVLLMFFNIVIAQENYVNRITPVQEKRIDSLFAEFKEISKPGVIMGIIHNNELVYQKSFGASNVASQSPITAQTKFQLAGMARHFTAFGILLLEHQKKLTLSDDARTYIPQLSHFSKPIRILDLLRNSDGLHDYNALKTVSGKPNAFKISGQNVLAIVERLQSSNFDPGTDYEYTDTGILLLTEVITKVSGMDFKDFMKKEVFEQMEMYNTTFMTSKNSSISNMATSYRRDQDDFVEAETFENIVGVSNLFSTIEDLIKWELHLMNPKPEYREVYRKLNTIVTLENKKEFSISLGKLTMGQQFTHKERGLNSTYHTGQYGGFASSMFRFPDQKYTAIVLSNNGLEYNGYFGVLAAHILLEGQFPEPPSIDVNALDIQPITPSEMKKYTGPYWDQKGGFYRTIQIKNDTLQYVRTNGFVSPLVYLGNHKFQMVLDWDDKIFVTFDPTPRKKRFWFTNGEADPILFEHFVMKPLIKTEVEEYVGTYYSRVLQTGYEISYTNNALVLHSITNEDVILTPIQNELFHGDQWYLRSIKFERNSKQRISGFYTAMSDANGVWFEKL